MIEALWLNVDYMVAIVLFLIGLYAVMAKGNLIKKLMGLNIMETAVFALILGIGGIEGGDAPIIGAGARPPFANPLPQALILTAIVVALSTTALALALVVRIYRRYQTLEADELWGVD